MGNMYSSVHVDTGYFGRVLFAYDGGRGGGWLCGYGGDGVRGVAADGGCAGASLWADQGTTSSITTFGKVLRCGGRWILLSLSLYIMRRVHNEKVSASDAA